jgi:hypothetical protein
LLGVWSIGAGVVGICSLRLLATAMAGGIFGVLPRSAAGMTGWCDLFDQVIPAAGWGWRLGRQPGQVRVWLCARPV